MECVFLKICLKEKIVICTDLKLGIKGYIVKYLLPGKCRLVTEEFIVRQNTDIPVGKIKFSGISLNPVAVAIDYVITLIIFSCEQIFQHIRISKRIICIKEKYPFTRADLCAFIHCIIDAVILL